MKFENRETYVGGSDFGSVLGVNPYKSRLSLVLEKANVIKNMFDGNEATRRGEKLEDEVIKRFEEETGFIVEDKQKVFEKPYASNLKMLCHVDGFIHSVNSVFEAKTTEAKGKVWDDGIPPYYSAQLEYNCYLSKADKAYIAVAFCSGDNIVDFKWFEYIPKLTEKHILDAMFDFVEDVKKAKKQYGVINNGQIIEADIDETLIEEYETIKEKLEENHAIVASYEKRKKEIEKKLKDLIGENLGVHNSLYEITLGNRLCEPKLEPTISRAGIKIKRIE